MVTPLLAVEQQQTLAAGPAGTLPAFCFVAVALFLGAIIIFGKTYQFARYTTEKLYAWLRAKVHVSTTRASDAAATPTL